MQTLRESFQEQGFSEPTTEMLLKSWRGATKKQYAPHITKWVHFCSEREVDKFSPPVNMIIEFLKELFDKGLGYSALNTARSALSSIVLSEKPIGEHPLVCRFVKAVFQERPTKPRYNVTWDVSLVLKLIQKWAPVKKLCLSKLTMKLVMLIALICPQRVQSFQSMKLSNMLIGKSSYTFVISSLVKQSRPGFKGPIMKMQTYAPDRRICPVTTLKEYLKRTEDIRGDSDELFISFVKPHKPVSRDSIRRWIKNVMELAGVDTSIFKPHSTRHASTSCALSSGMSIDNILENAGWSNSKVFAKYYNREVKEESHYAEAILSKVSH